MKKILASTIKIKKPKLANMPNDPKYFKCVVKIEFISSGEFTEKEFHEEVKKEVLKKYFKR